MNELLLTFVVVGGFQVRRQFSHRGHLLFLGCRRVQLASAFVALLDVSFADAVHLLLDVIDDLLLRLPLLLHAPQQVRVDYQRTAALTQHNTRTGHNTVICHT